jgi:hypothetical protein
LACEAETVVTLLPLSEQQYLRFQIAKTIQKLQNQQRETHKHTASKKRQEQILIKQIKEKLQKHNAMVTKSDKSNSMVIMYINTYDQKVLDFIAKSETTTTDINIIKQAQNEIRRSINNCNHTIDNNDKKWRLINMNPDTPTISGLIKIHKDSAPIRPIVNFVNAPSYKLAKSFTKTLQL